MANTYSKIYLHVIFAVKGRESLLANDIQPRIFQYMRTVVSDMGHTMVAVGGIENHVHLLLQYHPSQPLPDLIKQLKTATTKLINANKLTVKKFAWQRGYACFSYSPSHVDAVRNYILNQKAHHKKIAFHDELIDTFIKFGVEFDESYIFDEE